MLLTDFPLIKEEGREKTSTENRKQGWDGKEGEKGKQKVSETHRAKSCACANSDQIKSPRALFPCFFKLADSFGELSGAQKLIMTSQVEAFSSGEPSLRLALASWLW